MNKHLEAFLSHFNPQFIYGFFTAIIITSLVLFTQHGYSFYYLQASGLRIIPFFGTDLHWTTAIWYSLMVIFFFRVLGFLNMPERLWITFSLMLAFHGTYEAMYLLKFNLTGEFVYDNAYIIFPSLQENVVALIRIAGSLFFGYLFSRKYLAFNRKALLGWTVFFGFWAMWLYPAFSYIFNGSWSQETMVEISGQMDFTLTQLPGNILILLKYVPPSFHIINSIPLMLSSIEGAKRRNRR